MKHGTLLLLLASLFGAGFANAGVVTYTDTATGSGSLGGNSFTNSLITLTLIGDTGNVAGSGVFVNVGTLTVNVASLGTATFTDVTQAVDNQANILAGFGDNTENAFIMGTQNAVFGSYDLKTSIGPITGAALINSGTSFATDQGAFIIRSVGNTTFTASVTSATPEPPASALLGFGLAGIAALAWRRRKPAIAVSIVR